MLTRRKAFGLLGILGAMGLSGCSMLFPYKYRFRMTVQAVTPHGPREGSAVYEVWAYTNSLRLLSEERERDWGVKGEALVIELPSGPVFAMLETSNPLRKDLALLSMAALDPEFRGDVVESAKRIGRSWRKRHAVVPLADWPVLLRFRNLDDSTTVERVEPAALGIRRIVVETTGDEVTTGLKAKLRWLTDGGLTLDPKGGPTINPTFAQTVRQREFSSEIPQ